MSFAWNSKSIITAVFKNLNRTIRDLYKPDAGNAAGVMLKSEHVRFYKGQIQVIQPPPRPMVFHPAKLANVSFQSTSNSGYPIYNACLGPFIDNKLWFAEPKVGDSLKEEGELENLEIEKNDQYDNVSLEEIRKAIKEKNLKSREDEAASLKTGDV